MGSSGSTTTRRRSGATSTGSPGQRPEQKAGAKRKRASPGRPGRNAQTASLHAKEAHEAEAEALTSGIGQLETFIQRLRLIKDGTRPEPDEMRDWLSPETLTAMTEVIDENPRPSLEYILGVLGAQEVPKRLVERQRSQGARAFTAHLRNRAIRRKREAMEQKLKKAAVKPPVPPSQPPKGEKAKVKEVTGSGRAEKTEPPVAMKDTEKTDSQPAVDAPSQTSLASKPDTRTMPTFSPTRDDNVTQLDTIQMETDNAPRRDKETSNVLRNRSPHSEKAPIGIVKTEGALSEGAAKLEAVVKNGLQTIVGAKVTNDMTQAAKTGQDGRQEKLDQQESSNVNVAVTETQATKEEGDAKTQTQNINIHAPDSETDAKMVALDAETTAKRDAKEKSTQPSIKLPKHDANAGAATKQTGTRPRAEQISPPAMSHIPKEQVEGAASRSAAVNTDASKGSAQKASPEAAAVRSGAGNSREGLNAQTKRSIAKHPDKSSGASTVMKDMDHLRDGNAGSADHSDELANRSLKDTHENESPKQPEEAESEVTKAMGASDSTPTQDKQISDAKPQRGIPFKKREKNAGDGTGKARKDVEPEETVEVTASMTEEADTAHDGTSKSVGKSKARTQKTENTASTADGNVRRKPKHSTADSDDDLLEARPKGIDPEKEVSKVLDGAGSDRPAKIPRRKDSERAKLEPLGVRDSAATTEAEGASAIGEKEEKRLNNAPDQDERNETMPAADGQRAGRSKGESAPEETSSKPSAGSSTRKTEEEKKGPKKPTERSGRTAAEGVAKDGKGQKASRKAGSGKNRKSKETEAPRERRVGARRAGPFRDDLLHSSTRQTRLRRESSHLRDPTSLPPNTDPFVVDCFHVWKGLYQDKITIPFQKPVTKKDAPNYFDVIKHPMDLSTVRKHLEDGSIKNPQQFYDEMMLICSNALLFNDVESDLYDLALELRQKIKKAVKPLLKEWRDSLNSSKREDVGHVHPNVAQSDGDSQEDSEMIEKASVSSSESEESSQATDAANAHRGAARYPSRRGGEGGSSVASAGRGRKKKSGRGRGRGRGSRSKQTDDDSDAEDEDAVVVPPAGRGRGRGRRGGTSRGRGATKRAAKETSGPGRKPKRGRTADEDREDGRKRRRLAS